MTLYTNEPAGSTSAQDIEFKGFSTEKDCELASDAAAEIHMLKDAGFQVMKTECSEAENPGSPG